MRTRHKTPLVFTLSMVDMLCCALGCVILLWLLNAKQTEDDSEEQRQQSIALLAAAEAERNRREEGDSRLKSLLKDRDEAVRVSARLAEQLRLLQQSEARLQVQIGGERKLAKELERKLKDSGIRIVSLEGTVKKTA